MKDGFKDLGKIVSELQQDFGLYKEKQQEFEDEIQKINQAIEELRSKQEGIEGKLSNLESQNGNGTNNEKASNEGSSSRKNLGDKNDNMNSGQNKSGDFVTKEELKKDQDKQNADLMAEINKIVARLNKRIDEKARKSELDKILKLLQSKGGIDGKQLDMKDFERHGDGEDQDSSNQNNDNQHESPENLDFFQSALEAIQKQLQIHIETYDENKQNTDGRLDELERQMLSCVKQDDLKRVRNDLKQSLDRNIDKTSSLENRLNELKRIISAMTGGKGISEIEENGFFGGRLDQSNNSESTSQQKEQAFAFGNNANQGNWQKAIDDLRAELLALIQDLKNQIDKKADKDDLYNLEQMLLGKLDEVAGAVLIKLKSSASGPETAKKFSEIDKRLLQIWTAIFGEAEDALIVKKPLTKWSCISCDKDLNSYKGRLGNYHNWAVFPPKETSPEKQTKYGAQFGRYEKKLNVSGSSQGKKPMASARGIDSKLPNIQGGSTELFEQKNGQFNKTTGANGFNFQTPQKEAVHLPPAANNNQ